jgi:RHS repeat-associated protein
LVAARAHSARIAAALALVSACVAAPAQTVTYIHNDPAGNPVLATDANGNVVWKRTYKPYGEELDPPPAGAADHIGFSGHPIDQDTGLVYMGRRYYDPVLGRFLSPDPAEPDLDNLVQSLNRYAYGNNNPYRYRDPDGRSAVLMFAVPPLLLGGAWWVTRSPEQRESMIRVAAQAASWFRGLVFNESNGKGTAEGSSIPTGQDGTQGKKSTSAGTSNPMEGAPGSCSTCNNSKGNTKQDRYFGPDHWPEKDIDYDHNHKDANGRTVGQPHAHDWGRPPDGSRPTADDRGPARPLRPGEGQ